MKFITITFLLLIFVNTTSCKHSMQVTSEEQAYQFVQKVPEVQDFVADLVNMGAKPYIRMEASDNASLYEFYVGSNELTHTAVWKRFRVDRKTGQIQVYDNKADEYVPLDEWRTRVKTGLMSK